MVLIVLAKIMEVFGDILLCLVEVGELVLSVDGELVEKVFYLNFFT